MPSSVKYHYMERGALAQRQGDLEGAIAAYRQAAAHAPGDVQPLGLLGAVLLQSGNAAEALPCLQQAAAKSRSNAGLIATLAQALFELGRHAEAAATFRQAQRLAPANPQIMMGVATALAMQGQFAEARPLLERVVSRFPDLPYGWYNLGNVLRDLGQHVPAIDAYRKALSLAPEFLDARNGLGRTLHAALRFDEAASEYEQCIREAPQFVDAHLNLASVLIDIGNNDRAESVCRNLIAIAPPPFQAQAQALLADTYNTRGRMFESARHYAEAVRLAPENPDYAVSYAAKLCETGAFAEALGMIARIKVLAPDSPRLHRFLGTMFLQFGFLAEGWAEYRNRPAFKVFQNKLPGISLAHALPDNLAARHVCVLREQGLGDEIFFLRYVRELAARGARVSYRAGAKIASLVKRLPEISQVIDTEAPPPAADIHIMVGDLPHALRPPASPLPQVSEADHADAWWRFPWTQPAYSPLPAPSLSIAPLPEQLSAMRARLAALGPPPYLGVTWRGGTPPREQGAGDWVLFKTLGIAELGAALRSFQGTLISLQRNPQADETGVLEAAAGARVHDFSGLNDDLEAMLAVLDILDEYIAVSNTNVHLRACVGRITRVLVPAPPEWRWMAAGRFSPWFPAFPTYRQTSDGDWSGALASLAHDLSAAGQAL